MKIIYGLRRLFVVSCALGASLYGSTFQYSYLFNDGLVVSGTLTGTVNGQFVENVADVSVQFNGTDAPGVFFMSHFDGTDYLDGPIISFDGALNNFFFADSDLAGGDQTYNTFFYILNGSAGYDASFALSYPLDYYGSMDYPAESANWSLAPVTPSTSVPDSGLTGLLLSGALALLGVWRRRVRSDAPATRIHG